MKVAQLIIEMAANLARLQKDMDSATRMVGSAMSRIQKSADFAMRSLGALGVGLSVSAFANWIKGAIDAIDALNDISAATGIAVKELSGLEYAAKLSGTSLQAVTDASNKMQLSLTTNNAALRQIGITAIDPVEALIQLADVYAATEGQANKAAVASLALGRSWQSIAGLLAQGGEGLRNLMQEGMDLSGVTQQTAADAAKFNDEIDKLTTRLGALALNIAGPLLSKFSDFIDELNEGTKAAGGFWKAIGMFGLTNPFLTLEESVVKYRKEVEELIEKQQNQSELASIAFGTNEKLATATQRLAYFESMLAIETRKASQALAEGASGANAHVIAYNAMTMEADKYLLSLQHEFELIGLTNEERIVAIGMRKLEEIGIRSGTEAHEKYVTELIEMARRIGIKTQQVKLSEQAASNAKREAEEYDRLIKSLDEQIIKMQIENDTYFAGNDARDRAIFLRELENVKIEDRNRLLAQYDEAAMIKKANEERKKGIEKQLKQQEDYAKEMEKINDQIGQSLTDALMNGGMNAKEFIVNLFKTMVLRPILQPIIGAVTGAVTSLFAGSALAGGTAAAGASSMGQATGLLGLVGAAKTAYEVVAGGFNAVGTAASNLAATFMGQNLAVNAALIESGTIGTAGAALEANALATSQLAGTVGALAQGAAGIAAGIMAGNMISGKFTVGGSKYTATSTGAIAGAIIGSIIPGIGTAIGAVIGGALGGVVNRAFGMAPKETTSAGYELALAASGAITTGFEKWEQAGGWFRSSKSGKEITAVAQETVDFFNTSAAAIGSSVAGMTKMLGLSTDNIKEFNLDIVIETLGATKEQIEEQITGAFAFMETSLVDHLIPGIYEFAKAGDKTAADILRRLVSSVTSVNQAFEVLGYKLYDVSLQGAAASQKLVDLFGSLENFTKSTSFYYENFYSAQEKVAFQTQQLTKVFNSLGYELPNTRQQFRAFVEAAQAAGDDQLFATLVQLAPAFNTLTVAMEQANQVIVEQQKQLLNQIYQLLGDTATIRQQEIAGIDESNRALQEYVYALQDAQAAQNAANQAAENALKQLQDAIDAESERIKQTIEVKLNAALEALQSNFDSLTENINSQIKELEAQKSVATEALGDLRSIFSFLKDQIRDITAVMSPAQTAAEGMAFVAQAVRNARATGYLPDADQLRQAVGAARSGLGAESFGSSFEMRRANLQFANNLIALAEVASTQTTTAEEQVDLANQQIELLKLQLEQARQLYDDEVVRVREFYDAQIQIESEQLNVMIATRLGINNLGSGVLALNNGILSVNGGVLSVGTAIQNLSAAMSQQQTANALLFEAQKKAAEAAAASAAAAAAAAAKAAESVKETPTERTPFENDINKLYQQIFGREADLPGLKYWAGSGKTLDQIQSELYGSPEYRRLQIEKMYRDILKREADAAGLTYFMSSGDTLLDIEKILKESPEGKLQGYAKGGYYPGGMALVGEEGPEIIDFNRPGQIYTASESRAMMSGGQDTASEIRALREENRVQSRSMVALQARMTRLIERWDGDGLPEERAVA